MGFMDPLSIFETVAVKEGESYRIEHPHTGRWIKIPAADLSGIMNLVPAEIIASFQKVSTEIFRRKFIDAILAARLNRRLQSIWIQKGDTISLPAKDSDPPGGYYYPEKGEAVYFEGHGRIHLDPDLIVPIFQPKGILGERLKAAIRQHGKDPYTALAVTCHGTFTYLVQAKRLNGRKHLFGKLLHNGSQILTMDHWAHVTGWDAGILIRRCGIDIKKLQPVSGFDRNRLIKDRKEKNP